MRDRRRMLIANQQGGELPSGYTKLNYLKSTSAGGQYIVTNIYPTTDTIFNFKFHPPLNLGSNETNTLCGTRENNQTFYPACIFSQGTTGNAGWRYGTQTWQNLTSKFSDSDYVAKWEYKKLTLDGVTYQASGITSWGTMVNPMIIFGLNGSSVQTVRDTTFYYFNAEENGVMLINLIPALDTNNTPCMYDTVSRRPFYNSGSGTFLYG